MMCPQNAARESGFTDMVIPFAQQNRIGLLGMKVTAQDALLNRGVQAEELVRYSLSLPVSAMVIGISSLPVLESCANIARTLKPLSPAEMMATQWPACLAGHPALLPLPPPRLPRRHLLGLRAGPRGVSGRGHRPGR